MSDTADTDLRSRRRRETSEWIHRAALDLFEQQGVRDTTVQQIADRAGVSARTFFRYFATKEQAALPRQQWLVDAVDALSLDPASGAEHMFRAVYTSFEAIFGEADRQLGEHARVMALLGAEPELRSIAATQEEELVQRLQRRLGELVPDAHADQTTLVAEISVLLWRTTWRNWAASQQRGESREPVAEFHRALEGLRHVVCEESREESGDARTRRE